MDAIYVRQSVDKLDSISIEAQIEDCKKLVSEGATFKVYSDKGYSGKNTDRPAFHQMMEDIESGLIERVICWKLDRISRSVADFSQMLDKFRIKGITFTSAKEPILDTGNSALSGAIFGILMVFAQFERETIQMRVKENYYARGQQGFFLGGRAAYGFTKVPATLHGKKTYMLEPAAEQIEIVKTMYDMYANTGCSLGAIQKWLHENNIKTVKGNYFQKHAIVRILGNPLYVKADADVYTFLQSKGVHINNSLDDFIGTNGVFLYGSTKGIAREKYAGDGKEYATIGLHEGVIDSDVWLRVQHRLMNNHNFGSKGTGHKSWLTGLVRCGYCGEAVFFKDGGREGSKVYTICRGRIEKYCYGKKKALTSDVLEQVVEKHLLDYMKSLKVKTAKAKTKLSPEINAKKQEIAKREQEIDAYLDQVPNASKALIERINSRVEQLSKEIRDLQEAVSILTAREKTPEYGGLDLDEIIRTWPDLDLNERKGIAKVFIERVVIKDDEIGVEFF